MAPYILQAFHVAKSYRQGAFLIPVLQDVSVTCKQGESIAITGVSGSGKSTFIHLLAGLDEPTEGHIDYNNKDIATFNDEQRRTYRNVTIGLIFQSPYLIRELSVVENVMIKGLIAGLPREQVAQEAVYLLEQVGLAEKIESRPSELSGGQQQRVAFARALLSKPQFLLADEPTGNLDRATASQIISLMLEAQKSWGMGIIISSHDAYVYERMETKYELKNGILQK